MERKFQMVRLSAGDWLLPDNDERTLWRIQRYDDGADYGLDVAFASRSFWRLMRCRYEIGEDIDITEDAAWVEVHSWLPTRQAAIDSALQVSR